MVFDIYLLHIFDVLVFHAKLLVLFYPYSWTNGKDMYDCALPKEWLDHHHLKPFFTTFQFACALSNMKPLKLTLGTSFSSMIAFRFSHNKIWAWTSFDCISSTCYSEYFVAYVVVDMTYHHNPIMEAFNMVKYDPRILHVSIALYAIA